jgi:ATP-dependent helicase/nuclease subunit B
MAIRVRTGSLIEYLEDKAADTADVPARHPDGICILSGQLLKQNLKETLNRQSVPTATLSHYTTIEDLARAFLEPTDTPSAILADGIRDRLVEGILTHADPNPNPENETVPVEFDDIVQSTEKSALEALANKLPYGEEDTRESLITEFDDFLRWTDAATDVATATRQLAQLNNRFAQVQSNRSLTAFKGIERTLESKLESLGLEQHQSRSHLVHAARDHIAGEWTAKFDHVEWITIAGISVFDNPTLRFIETLAAHDQTPDVEIFMGAGSAEYNIRRFDSLPTANTPSPGETQDPTLPADAADALLSATIDPPDETPENAAFIEAPSDQRAVEYIATEVRELVRDGTHPRDILIVAPDAGSYQSLVEQAFRTVEIPVHVETRRPYANIPAYRCFRTLIDIVDAVVNDRSVTYGELVDPLRLGYCPRGSHGRTWPIEGREFTKVEQELHRKQQFYNNDPDRYEDQGIEFSEWQSLIDEIPEWTGPWRAVTEYLEDIESLAEEPPASGSDLVDLFGRYLGTYVFQTVDHERELNTGPAIDLTRTTLDEPHATNEAERVRSTLDDVGNHYNRVQELFGAPESWFEVGRAFSAVLGGKSYGKSHLDQYAVPVVDAGNAYFRDAEHAFFLGMNADEFPGESATRTFLHRELREAVYEQAEAGENPYHHLDSRASNYQEALDFYQAGLSTLVEDGEIQLYHSYHDERGNEIAWSSFVDLFDVTKGGNLSDRPVKRLSVGEWVPNPDSNTVAGWEDLTSRVAPRERLRMLLYFANQTRIPDSNAISETAVEAIAARLEPYPLSALVLPRVDRHLDPPTSVSIQPDEPAFNEVSLDLVTGGPHYPHELDLQAQCGLKYYYYQFMHNFTGSDPEREEIPKYYSQSPHWRLGQLPYLVRENYADPRYVDKWQEIIMNLLPDRQSTTTGLAQFDSDQDLRRWVQDQDRFSDYDMNTIYQNLSAERDLVMAERNAGITRSWQWRSGGKASIHGKDLAVPAYRLDTVRTDNSTYTIPIFFTRFTQRARSALKSCFDGAVWEADERTGEFCLNCGREDRCNYHSKYVIDHRMLAGYNHETNAHDSKVVGIGMQEQYAGPTNGERVIAIQNNYIDIVTPSGEFFEQLVQRGYPQDWEDSVADWEANFSELTTAHGTTTEVELTANPTVVNRDDCLDCVYRGLCQVPDSEVELE